MKLMSFNVRMSGQLTDYNIAPFASLVGVQQPDVVVLQEVDLFATRSGKKDFLTELAELTGMFPLFAKAIAIDGGEYGLGILSKYPVSVSKIVSLPFPTGAKERRIALVAEILLPGNHTVKVVSTHLDHSTANIRMEMIRELNTGSVLYGNLPVLLGGDFNAGSSEDGITVGMKNWSRLCDNSATYPASSPTSKIDYLFGYPASKWSVVRFNRITNDISDHCAIIAEVEYKK